MGRVRFALQGIVFSLVLVFGLSASASAETRAVNCDAAGDVNTELSLFANRNVANVLNVSGICDPVVNIVGFNNLTVQGPGTLTHFGVNIINSQNVLLKTLLIKFDQVNAPFGTVSLAQAGVVLDGVTVQDSLHSPGITVGPLGLLSFGSATPSLVTNNGGNGISVNGGSANVRNVTVSNNGLDAANGSYRNGIQVSNGGRLVLGNQIGGVPVNVDISGNARRGVMLDNGGTLETDAESNNGASIHIHNNGDVGVEIDGGSAHINGHIQLDGNSGQCIDPNSTCDLGVFGGGLNLEDGVQIGNGFVGGNATAAIDPGAGTPVNITGTLALSFGAVALLIGPSTIGSLICDETSWAPILSFGGPGPTIGTNTCPTNGPTGITGPAGPQGPAGSAGPQGIQGPQGIPGIANLETVIQSKIVTLSKASQGTSGFVTAVCPSPKTAISGSAVIENLNFVVYSQAVNIQNRSYTVFVKNTANSTQTGTINAYAVCAVVQ